MWDNLPRIAARSTRRHHTESARAKLQAKLSEPVRRLADLFWEAHRDYSAQASRYAATLTFIATLGAAVLSLGISWIPGLPFYAAKASVLLATMLVVSTIAAGCVAYLVARRNDDLRNCLRVKLPNLYRIDETLASEICDDAFSAVVRSEYQEQMRHAKDFVERVRLERLEREESRTLVEKARASGWIDITSTLQAEQVWIRRLLVDSASKVRGHNRWAVAQIGKSDYHERQWGVPLGAAFAMFVTTTCSKCDTALKCDQPFQTATSPVGELFGPDSLSETIPPTGVYEETWLPHAGGDIFSGEWLCPSCYQARAK